MGDPVDPVTLHPAIQSEYLDTRFLDLLVKFLKVVCDETCDKVVSDGVLHMWVLRLVVVGELVSL